MNEKQSLVFIISIPRWALLRAVQLIRLSAVCSVKYGIVVPLRVPFYDWVYGRHCYSQFVITGWSSLVS